MKKLLILLVSFLSAGLLVKAQTPGCTDPAANNFNGAATLNNGSCTYNNVTLTPVLKYNLSTTLNETSGLMWWDNKVWTHEDSGNDPAIFGLDSATGTILRTVTINNATNIDWEDMAQDDDYIYVGDFGNNANGNRTNLRIYKIAKTDVLAGNNVTATIINYSYEDQTSFAPTGSNNTNFDCEAMIAYGNSLFLFSKNWVNQQTKLYELPKTPGTYTAVKRAELNVQGLITGADIVPSTRTIVLTGYNTTLTPFLYLLYDFTGNNFFAGNKRKVALNATFTQMEGIAAIKPEHFFVSNERFQQVIITTPARYQTVNLSSLIGQYLSILPIHSIELHAKRSGNDVLLNWKIIPEDDLASLEIERKTNADNRYAVIQKLYPGTNRFADRLVFSQYHSAQYRLKAYDKDNEISYSKEIIVKRNQRNTYTITSSRNSLQLTTDAGARGWIEIFSADGSLKLRNQIISPVTLLDTRQFAPGIYIARITIDGEQQVSKFLK